LQEIADGIREPGVNAVGYLAGQTGMGLCRLKPEDARPWRAEGMLQQHAAVKEYLSDIQETTDAPTS